LQKHLLALFESKCYRFRMDTFHAYFKSLAKAEREKIADEVGTSVAYLWQIAYKQRRCKESLAIEIEKASGQRVRVEDLRPDVDWAYLRNSAESIANSRPITTANGVATRISSSDDTQPPAGGTVDDSKFSKLVA
jgi:DNA-binding transcriptional regulator YdaS (Cro superfamily)